MLQSTQSAKMSCSWRRNHEASLSSYFRWGNNAWKPLKPGAKRKDEDLSEVPLLLHVKGLSDTRRVKFIRYNDCAQAVSCVIDSFSLLCAWCTVLNAADSLGRYTRMAIEALEADVLEDPDHGFHEVVSLPEISHVAPGFCQFCSFEINTELLLTAMSSV